MNPITMKADSRSPERRVWSRHLVFRLVCLAGVTALSGHVGLAAQETSYEEEGGTFGDGTRYLIRVPSNWNGVLVRDLDYVTGANRERYLAFLERGYAVSGTARHERRWVGGYDPAREIERIEMVHDVFIARFREPEWVLQYGCSGGGRVGTALAEDPGRVDGVVAGGTAPIVWVGNSELDKWFVLKALLAPELPIVNLPKSQGLRPEYPDLTFAWRQVFNEAQRTPEGRARIALAVTIGQFPDWVDLRLTKPDRSNVAELQQSMYQSTLRVADRIGGVSRFMLETSSSFGARSYQYSWNDGVDYKEFFDNGSEYNKRAVRQLYEEAGVELEADLEKVNAFPRISADPEGIEYWGAAGRIAVGQPRIPVIRWHDIGDEQILASNVQGYMELVRKNGKEDLVRTVYTELPTHCGFTVAESIAVLETMMHRLETGSWGSTDPEHLNQLARSIEDGSVARFISVNDQYKVRKYNRTWVPNWVGQSGPSNGREN